MSPPQRKTSKVGQAGSTASMNKSATTASLQPAFMFSWEVFPSAKCASTSGRSTWSAKVAPSPVLEGLMATTFPILYLCPTLQPWTPSWAAECSSSTMTPSCS